MIMAAPLLSFGVVLSESNRILKVNPRHFLSLSLIFLLPLSISLLLFPTLFHLFSLSFLFPLFFSLILLTLSLFATASITVSVFHSLFNRPIKLLPSALSSFLPLLATTILTHLFLRSYFGLFFPLKLLHHIPALYYPLSALTLLLVLFLEIYVRVIWTLSSVVVIAESTWGFTPLRRSETLMKGMKTLGFYSLCFFSLLEGVMLCGTYALVMRSDGWWKEWTFVVVIALSSPILMLLMLYNIAANAVLYMYCVAVHGEPAVEEFAAEYISLPVDEGKVPHCFNFQIRPTT